MMPLLELRKSGKKEPSIVWWALPSPRALYPTLPRRQNPDHVAPWSPGPLAGQSMTLGFHVSGTCTKDGKLWANSLKKEAWRGRHLSDTSDRGQWRQCPHLCPTGGLRVPASRVQGGAVTAGQSVPLLVLQCFWCSISKLGLAPSLFFLTHQQSPWLPNILLKFASSILKEPECTVSLQKQSFWRPKH